MEIEEARAFIDISLESISSETFAIHSSPCPHCRIPIRYPTIAREQDIEDFRLIMSSAEQVMKAYGITGNLLADIRAACYIELAKRDKETK